MDTRDRTTALALLILLLSPLSATAQTRYEIDFPDLPGYVTLACDLHMHTVFSDGQVWPTTRVAEAWRQGLDCMAITDHIEYQPHKDDVPTQHNRPYDLARGAAATSGLILLRGTEITRDTPPGHFNALFLDDVDPLETDGLLDVMQAADDQGAFIFWNHQGWKGEERGSWREIHTTIFEKGWLKGMEVANGDGYHPSAHRWCLEKNLTMLGNSDIHAPCLITESTSDNHRTLTLVFAKERSAEGVKEALLAGRTAVWFLDQLIGRQEVLAPLINACIQIETPTAWSPKSIYLPIRNVCDADLVLKRRGRLGPEEITLTAGATTMVRITGAGDVDSVKLEYVATNVLIGIDQGLPLFWEIAQPEK